MEHINKAVSEQIDAALDDQNRSERWLAMSVGIPTTTFHRKMEAHTAFTVPELIAVESALGITPGSILEQVLHAGAGKAAA